MNTLEILLIIGIISIVSYLIYMIIKGIMSESKTQIYFNDEYTEELIESLNKDEIFVYGSNRQGILGGGSAFYAKTYFGAEDGIPKGITGQCYGIVTKDYDVNIESGNMKSVPLEEIRQQIVDLYFYAKQHSNLKFLVTKIGSERAGYDLKEIATCFTSIPGIVPHNIILPYEFVLDKDENNEI